MLKQFAENTGRSGRLGNVIFLVLLAWLAFVPQAIRAHPLSYIHGEAVVYPDKLKLSLDISPEDILLSAGISMMQYYDDVAKTDNVNVAKADIVKGIAAHKKYLLNGIVIQDGAGHRLTGKVTKLDAPVIPDAGFQLDDLMGKNFIYHITYPLPQPPEKLGFRQRFNTGDVAILVVMQLIVSRAGKDACVIIPVSDSDKPKIVAFDWKSTTTTPANAMVKPVTLEASDAFLYIQNDELRLEIMMPVPVLETWMSIQRADPKYLEVAEQTALLPELDKFFIAHSEVKIDGVLVKPKLDRVDFFGIDSSNFAMRPPSKRLTAKTSHIGVILTYSTKGAPRDVEAKWTLFNDKAITVRAVVFAYDKGVRFALGPAKPMFGWKNPGVSPLPKIEALLSQQDADTDTARATVVETLLRNVYRGFDYRDESDIYDALAQSVQGDLLTDLYLKIKRSLIVQKQGGAVANVQKVKVIKSELLAGNQNHGFRERVTWQVTGTVEHWGHIHTRVNEYTADLGIDSSDKTWKINSMKVVKQAHVRSSMSARKL